MGYGYANNNNHFTGKKKGLKKYRKKKVKTKRTHKNKYDNYIEKIVYIESVESESDSDVGIFDDERNNIMIKEWNQKEWIKRRTSLNNELSKCEGIGGFTLKRYDEVIAIEGGVLPMQFSDNGELKVWNRGSRHSGRPVTVSELREIENTVKLWLDLQKNM